MVKGIYKYSKNDKAMNDYGTIIIHVSETDKSYILRLIENTCRYSPAHIDMLFAKNNKAIINKNKSLHTIKFYDNGCFVIYPYRGGIPFLFEREEINE